MSALPYTEQHEMLRAAARRFFEQEFAPHCEEWETAGVVPRAAWLKAAEVGLLCPTVSQEYGGAGGNVLDSVIILEEQVRAGVPAMGLSVHNDVVAPYIELYGTEEQKRRCLPRLAHGEWIGAIAMTEPHAGSDLGAIRTTARLDGDAYVINGSKIFISNGCCADLIIVAAKTAPDRAHAGMSLFLFEAQDAPGFSRGSPLAKIGQPAFDTAELFFDDVRVPTTALLGGKESCGFAQLMERLPFERLMTGAAAVAIMEHALEITIQYTRQRRVFGRAVLDFQNTRFKLAEARTEATIARIFLNRGIQQHLDGSLDAVGAAMLKWWTSEQQCRVVDSCLQFHGGYGYMVEYPIARLWRDSRAAKIYGGANEVMKEIIARALERSVRN